MVARSLPINIYLALALAVAIAATLAGCSSPEGTTGKDSAIIRLHLETNSDGTPNTRAITVLRSHPIRMSVVSTPILDYTSITNAFIVGNSNNFRIAIELDRRGTRMLESAMLANRGRRIAVYSIFTEERWLAAPRVAPITDGVFAFTPDATLEESQHIVSGLLNEIKRAKRKSRSLLSSE